MFSSCLSSKESFFNVHLWDFFYPFYYAAGGTCKSDHSVKKTKWLRNNFHTQCLWFMQINNTNYKQEFKGQHFSSPIVLRVMENYWTQMRWWDLMSWLSDDWRVSQKHQLTEPSAQHRQTEVLVSVKLSSTHFRGSWPLSNEEKRSETPINSGHCDSLWTYVCGEKFGVEFVMLLKEISSVKITVFCYF